MAKQKGIYRLEMCEKVPGLYINGESDVEVAIALGVSKKTFYQWVREKPEFAEAVELGKNHSECWWQKLGRAGAEGSIRVQPTIWFANMQNRFGWKNTTTLEDCNEMALNQTLKDLKQIVALQKKHEKEY